ncbi:MAG: PqiC family protein [Verrucomicrobiota bacterium]
MTKQLAWLIAVVSVTGCASSSSRFYTLSSTAKPTGATASYAVLVGPVTVPALVDRPQFTVQVATNRVALDEFNRWAAPLSESIARVITADLSVLLGTSHVATAPLANFESTYRVTVDIQRFESKPNEAAVIEAMWVVRRSAGGTARSGHTVAREATQGADSDALAAAHSRALAKVSADIAAGIRAEAEVKP